MLEVLTDLFTLSFLYMLGLIQDLLTLLSWFFFFPGSNSSSVSQVVMNGANIGVNPAVPTDDDVLLSVVGNGGDGGGENCSPTEMTDLDLTEVVLCETNVVVPLSASRLRLLQDTTMIESALDLDSLEESSVGAGSQAGLLKLSAV